MLQRIYTHTPTEDREWQKNWSRHKGENTDPIQPSQLENLELAPSVSEVWSSKPKTPWCIRFLISCNHLENFTHCWCLSFWEYCLLQVPVKEPNKVIQKCKSRWSYCPLVPGSGTDPCSKRVHSHSIWKEEGHWLYDWYSQRRGCLQTSPAGQA